MFYCGYTDKNLLCVISCATQASDIPLYLKANTFHQELDEEEEEREKKNTAQEVCQIVPYT